MSNLQSVKSLVSNALLKKVPGVTGVGLPSQGVTIYLEEDRPELRAQVLKTLEALKLDVKLHWSVTGAFKK